MEIKMNKDIRTYTESMFFGLSLRQFFFSALGCLVSVTLYFLLRRQLGTEAVSWACMLGVFPFGVMGFAKYNGMAAEQVLRAVIKSVLLTPKRLPYRGRNLYYDLIRGKIKC